VHIYLTVPLCCVVGFERWRADACSRFENIARPVMPAAKAGCADFDGELAGKSLASTGRALAIAGQRVPPSAPLRPQRCLARQLAILARVGNIG
jgi:hypothetical protein